MLFPVSIEVSGLVLGGRKSVPIEYPIVEGELLKVHQNVEIKTLFSSNIFFRKSLFDVFSCRMQVVPSARQLGWVDLD